MRSSTDKPILVYPNTGEIWDTTVKEWKQVESSTDIKNMVDLCKSWKEAGCNIIGGCCRTDIEYVRALREFADVSNTL